MTVTEFIAKWGKVQLTERSAAQQHFLALNRQRAQEAKQAGALPEPESSVTEGEALGDE